MRRNLCWVCTLVGTLAALTLYALVYQPAPALTALAETGVVLALNR